MTPSASRSPALLAALAALALLATGCTRGQLRLNPMRSTARDPGGLQQTRLPAARRIIAVGDIHGDLGALLKALRMSGLIDVRERWVGGTTVLVQTGDILDRGDDEVAILELFAHLRAEAAKAGGRVITLVGNHEIMNALGDFRYTTSGGFQDFESTPGLELPHRPGELPALDAARRAAWKPGGPWARRVALFGVVAIVGKTLFVHGGIHAADVRHGLDRINREVRMWLLGDRELPRYIVRATSPVWTRLYAQRDSRPMCTALQEALAAAGVERMVVGHTPQMKGISSGCGGRVWRIDTGMTRAYGGRPAALELVGAAVRVIDRFEAISGAARTGRPQVSGLGQ